MLNQSTGTPYVSKRRPGRANILTALALFLAFMTMPASPAIADGTGWPPHTVRGVSCDLSPFGQVQVRAYPPSHVTSWYGGSELVEWMPILYWWNGVEWVETAHPSAYSASAEVTSNGLNPNVGWRSNIGQLSFFPFMSDLQVGHYTVIHQIHWQSTGQVHYEWAPNSCELV